MRVFTFITLLLVRLATAQAQSVPDTIFYDYGWNPIETGGNAKFYRLQWKQQNGYEVKDYYINGTLQMSGFFRSFNPEIKEDTFKYYHENGQLSSVGRYEKNKKVGVWKKYNAKGELIESLNYGRDGGPPVVGLSGESILERPEIMPEFPGGVDSLLRYISTNLIYPKEALKKKIEGRVIIRFVVTKEGKVTDVSAVKKVHPLLDQSAIDVVKAMPQWTPGEENGKKVNVYFTLPISFRL